MPNWREAVYKIVGDESELNELKAILDDIKDKLIIENDFGSLWLGNLINKLGGDYNKCDCRGEIVDYDLTDGVLTIYQQTAWCEQEDVRYAIAERFPSLSIYFLEEEPGLDVYYTNDEYREYFPYRWKLSVQHYDNNGDIDVDTIQYLTTLDVVSRCIKDYLNIDVRPDYGEIVDALNKYNDENDTHCCLNEFEYVEQ